MYLCFLCILHGVFPHGDTDLTLSITLFRWKTEPSCLCVKCNVKCRKLVVTITLNSIATFAWWLLCDRLPWLPDIQDTSPSICAVAIACTLPCSNLPYLPFPSFHHFFPPQYKCHSLREERRRSRLFESWGSRRTELSRQRREKGSDEQQGL